MEKKYKFTHSCAPAIHVSYYGYWDSGDTWIAVEFTHDDIITCQEGKLRIKKCKVIGEVKI